MSSPHPMAFFFAFEGFFSDCHPFATVNTRNVSRLRLLPRPRLRRYERKPCREINPKKSTLPLIPLICGSSGFATNHHCQQDLSLPLYIRTLPRLPRPLLLLHPSRRNLSSRRKLTQPSTLRTVTPHSSLSRQRASTHTLTSSLPT